MIKDLENEETTNYNYKRDSNQIVNFADIKRLNKTNIDREYYI